MWDVPSLCSLPGSPEQSKSHTTHSHRQGSSSRHYVISYAMLRPLQTPRHNGVALLPEEQLKRSYACWRTCT